MAVLAFKGSIEAFAKKAGLSMDNAVRRTVLEVLKGVVEATPVDSGRARANWQVTAQAPAEGLAPDTNAAGVLARELPKVNTLKAGVPAYITNNVPYILAIEYGQYPNPPKRGTHLKKGQSKGGFTGPGWFMLSEGGYSRQAPQGMARITVQRVTANFNAVLAGGEA